MISLIIPLYNAADHLERLTTSVKMALDRVVASVEVVFVDDGSSDSSASILQSVLSDWVAQGETRARLVCQKNQGRGGARNTGIACATQAYIGFLDADDYMYPEYFEALLACVCTNSDDMDRPDIVEFNSDCFVVREGQDERRAAITRTIDDYACVTFASDPGARLRVFTQGHWFAWLRLYRRELFRDVSFPRERNYEDLDTVPQLFLAAERVEYLPIVLVSYQINPVGIMQSPAAADEDSLQAISMEHFAASRKTTSDLTAICELLVACAALRSLYYVSEKRHGRMLGIARYRIRFIRVMRCRRRIVDVTRVWPLLDIDTRKAVFAPEYMLAHRVAAKLKRLR